MWNVNLLYKPYSSRRILFRYGGRPRQLSRLKIFRALVVPGGGCRKGGVLQGRQIPSGLPIIGQSFLRIKVDVTVASVHALIQSNSNYIQAFIHYI